MRRDIKVGDLFFTLRDGDICQCVVTQVRTTEKIDYYKLSEGEIEGVTDNEVTAITADDEVFDIDDKIFATMNELLDHLQDNAHKFADKESVKRVMGGYAKPF